MSATTKKSLAKLIAAIRTGHPAPRRVQFPHIRARARIAGTLSLVTQ